jgi:hypothetical protein
MNDEAIVSESVDLAPLTSSAAALFFARRPRRRQDVSEMRTLLPLVAAENPHESIDSDLARGLLISQQESNGSRRY